MRERKKMSYQELQSITEIGGLPVVFLEVVSGVAVYETMDGSEITMDIKKFWKRFEL